MELLTDFGQRGVIWTLRQTWGLMRKPYIHSYVASRTVRIFKSRRRKVVLAAVCFAILLTASFALLHNSPGWRFFRSYNRLQLGMTQDEVRELFGTNPDFDCRYKSFEIWYYRAPDWHAGDFDDVELERGATVQSLDDLPDVYDHVQLAFDNQGRLHAYTWIGETYTVETKNGSVNGSHFAELSPSDF